MCGRYATSRSSADLSALFDTVDETEEVLAADYNVAPTDPVPIVRVSSRAGGVGRVLSAARWGLVPPWAKDPRVGARMINARAETLTGSRAYARPFAQRRCLVPADGWYEWSARAAGKQAYFMTPADGSVLAFAGIWTAWRGSASGGPGGPVRPTPEAASEQPAELLLTFSVVTTAAIGELALVHGRMPLVLPPSRWSSWLAGPPGADLLAAPGQELVAGLEIRPVGPAVGDVRNDGPSLLVRVDASPLTEPAEPRLF